LIEVSNPHLFVFKRYSFNTPSEHILVIANFDNNPQHLNMHDIADQAIPRHGRLIDLYTGQTPETFNGTLVVPALSFYWLREM
jgi:amylosucrase